jgi:hypothetical protein
MDDFLLIHAGWDGNWSGKQLLSPRIGGIDWVNGPRNFVDLFRLG